MAYNIIYSYNYVYNNYVIAWIISGILILSLQLTLPPPKKGLIYRS